MSELVMSKRQNCRGGVRDNTITIVRVAAMLMIIGCHLCNYLRINILAMVLNVGVYVFLLISGILYSNRRIDDPCTFLKRRWIKLCVPMYYLILFLLITSRSNPITDTFKALPIYFLNLQGIDFLFPIRGIPHIKGAEHLWFLTIIMLCYIALIFVKWYETEESWSKKLSASIMALLIGLDVILAYKEISLQYFLTFFIGYRIGKCEKTYSKKQYATATLGMLIAMAVRLLGRHYMDGTIAYNFIIVSFTHIVLALWIYRTVRVLSQIVPGFTQKLAGNRIVSWLEKYSLFLYMTHYMFIIGPFYVSSLGFPKGIEIAVFGVFTVVSAIVLELISHLTIRLLWK